MTEPLTASGGICATPTRIYDTFSTVDAERLHRAKQAAVEHALNRISVTVAEVQELVTVAITEYTRAPVEFHLPDMTVNRGAIKYIVPPKLSERRKRWLRWGPVRTVTAVKAKTRRRVEKVTAFRTKVADTRAVWHGTKTAMTDAELDDLREW